jgi:hypothetical protein
MTIDGNNRRAHMAKRIREADRPSSRRLQLAVAGIAVCMAVGSLASGAAAQERFAGQWTIAGAVVAPWSSDPKGATDDADVQRLVGKRIALGAHFFNAPHPLGCAKPTYVFRAATADTLFEGSLNVDGANKPTDPVVVARSLGLKANTVRGMTANCSEVEFFLFDPDTILFGLNNRVFTVKRAK